MKWSVPLLFFCATLFLLGCQHNEKAQILDALHNYDRLIQKMDADSISLLYTPDGELGTAAKGREAIRNFLSSFTNVKVLSVASQSDSITVNNNTANQSGTYTQEAVVSGKDTLRLRGKFSAVWQKVPDEGWRIKRMSATPAQ